MLFGLGMLTTVVAGSDIGAQNGSGLPLCSKKQKLVLKN
jgi:hypothetical protein